MEFLSSEYGNTRDNFGVRSVTLSHHIFGLQGYGGISRYFLELAGSLRKKGIDVRTDAGWTLGASEGPFQLQKLHRVLNRRGVGWRMAGRLNAAHAKWHRQSHLVETGSVYHRTYYSDNSNHTCLPEVVTVYDMIHEDFAEYFKRPILKKKIRAIRQADQIICISEYTRQRLLRYVPEVSDRISVVHLGLSVGYVREPSEILPSLLEKPMLAYIGGRHGYKNFSVLLRALAQTVNQDLEVGLKVIGPPLTARERSDIHALGISNLIVESVNPESIDSALEDCCAVVSTSFAEGFGLVSLEAGRRRIPLLSSDIPVMREVLGESALYFPPSDPNMLQSQIRNLLNDKNNYLRWSRAIFDATERYSVENMTAATIEAYDEAIRNHSQRRGKHYP